MVIVYLAQRFQVITKFSPLDAGIHIIPYSAVATVATMLACLASRKFRIPVVYFALLGSIFHTVGMALLSILPETESYPSEGYGYEAIAGAGVGITIGILTLAVPFIVETRDLGKKKSLPSLKISIYNPSDVKNSHSHRFPQSSSIFGRGCWIGYSVEHPLRKAQRPVVG